MVRDGRNVQLVTESEGIAAPRVRHVSTYLTLLTVGSVRDVVVLSICFLQETAGGIISDSSVDESTKGNIQRKR
jgi:hypothetical protein